MSDANQVDAVEGLFAETPNGPRLLGSRCNTCSTPYFPKADSCHNPQCEGGDVVDAEFGPGGTLWSIAIQNYPPPPPAIYDEPYAPYAVGVVDLAEGLRVLGRMAVDDPSELEVGGPVELVIAPLATSASGEATVSWQFKPGA